MIIASIFGGLGNQMFEYAAARRLALHRKTDLKLDLSDYRTGSDTRPEGLSEFRRPVKLYELCVTAPAASESEIASLRDPYSNARTWSRIIRQVRKNVSPDWLWPASHFRENDHRFDPRVLALLDPTYLHGYLQSEKYFDDIADTIYLEFQPKNPDTVPYARQYVDRVRGEGGAVVALHVRRGDLAHGAEQLKNFAGIYSGPLGLDYIRGAIGKFDSSVRFLVFSDTPSDIEWCRRHIPTGGLPLTRLHFSEGHTDIQDMAIMSACDHNIIANSTFSWWAAWLNRTPGRRVIAPSTWCTPGSPADIPTEDLIPAGWEKI
jgi:hypothetical protein